MLTRSVVCARQFLIAKRNRTFVFWPSNFHAPQLQNCDVYKLFQCTGIGLAENNFRQFSWTFIPLFYKRK